MYARFHPAKRRLVVKLVASRRIGGKVQAEHIAPLGSVLLPEPFSLSERTKFWEALEGRLSIVVDRIGERFSAEERRKVIAGIDRRIPTERSRADLGRRRRGAPRGGEARQAGRPPCAVASRGNDDHRRAADELSTSRALRPGGRGASAGGSANDDWDAGRQRERRRGQPAGANWAATDGA